MTEDSRKVHFRDMEGQFLWAEDPAPENKHLKVGDEYNHIFDGDVGRMIPETWFVVEMVAITELAKHVNLKRVEEDLAVGGKPHL